jgi:hypothetical protein
MIPRHAKAQLAKAGPAVDHQASRPKDNRSDSIKKAVAVQTAPEPTWPAGDDVMAVGDGRTTVGLIKKIGASYIALDVSGAVLGDFISRASAFGCVADSARAKQGGAP